MHVVLGVLMIALPASQLAILLGTSHLGILERPDLMVAMENPFLGST